MILVGAALRHLVLVFDDFRFVIAGNLFVALAQFLLQSCVTIVANKWFGDSERNFAMTVCMMACSVGHILAYTFIFCLFAEKNTGEGFYASIKIQTIMLCTVAVLGTLFIESQPAVAPSRVALQEETKMESLGDTLRQIWRNKNLVLVTVSNSLIMSGLYVYGTLSGMMFEVIGFDLSFITQVMIVNAAATCLFSLAMGLMLEKWRRFVPPSRIFAFICLCSNFGSIFYFNSDNKQVAMVLFVTNMCWGAAVYCLSVTWVAECSFPMEPALATGFKIIVVKTVGGLMTMAGTYIVSDLTAESVD